MRKTNALMFVLMLGVMAFMAVPAFAEYTQSHSQAGGWDLVDTIVGPVNHPTFGNTVLDGFNAPEYGPASIRIPYSPAVYDFAGCDAVLDINGNSLPTTYSCTEEEGTTGDSATLILQDVFGMMLEGTVEKAAGSMGIAQFLDSLFDWTGDGEGTITSQYIDQTLDQDLADLSLSTPTIGIWQRLHTSFDRVANSSGLDEDGMDQTVESFMSDEAVGGTASTYAGGQVISYMAQWFQKGSNHECGDPGTNCVHNEFGGHGSLDTGTTFVPNQAQHDP